jgi:hypothetical protein
MDSASITIKTRSLHREYGARNLDPFRGEKNINWEGGFRVPCIVRWPGVIKPGTVINDIVAHWMIDHVFLLLLTQAIVGQFPMSFKEFPPRQRPAFIQRRSAAGRVAAAGGTRWRLRIRRSVQHAEEV